MFAELLQRDLAPVAASRSHARMDQVQADISLPCSARYNSKTFLVRADCGAREVRSIRPVCDRLPTTFHKRSLRESTHTSSTTRSDLHLAIAKHPNHRIAGRHATWKFHSKALQEARSGGILVQ